MAITREKIKEMEAEGVFPLHRVSVTFEYFVVSDSPVRAPANLILHGHDTLQVSFSDGRTLEMNVEDVELPEVPVCRDVIVKFSSKNVRSEDYDGY